MAKVKIIAKDATGKEVPFFTKTLTKEFLKRKGETFAISIEEPNKEAVLVGDYTVQGVTIPDPHQCQPNEHWDEQQQKCVPDDITPICEGHSHWDGTKCVCDSGYHEENGECIQDELGPCPPGQHWDEAQQKCIDTPIPPTGGVIYDSNVDGKWNNGVSRIIKDKDGDISPNGKGLFTAASGSPEVHIDGKGTAILVTKPGFGRFYICVNNFNAQIDFDFNIMDSSVDNMSLKGRSRHQAGGNPENRFGGLGNATSTKDTDFKIEFYHNVHDRGYNKNLPQPLKVGEWYSKRYIYKNSEDNKTIHFEDWIDFKDGKGLVKVFERTEQNPRPYFMDRTKFDQESWIWNRLNGSGSIAFKNYKVTAL